MSSSSTLKPVAIGQFAEQFRNDMIPLGNRFSYFCAATGLTSEDMREYLEEPVAALPPKIAALLPSTIQILLVPYLERGATTRKDSASLMVSVQKPSGAKSSSSGTVLHDNRAVLAFAVNDTEVADHHYHFYRAIAEIVAERASRIDLDFYATLLREELSSSVHGEVDEAGWRMKQQLTRRGTSPHRETKLLRDYQRQSLVDTLTLYLHGICCDIDVETGPRQLPSRWLKRRLTFLRDTYPPPEGYAVFPEESRAQ